MGKIKELESGVLHVNSATGVSKDKLEDVRAGTWEGEVDWSQVRDEIGDENIDIVGRVSIREAVQAIGGYSESHARYLGSEMLKAGFVKDWYDYPATCQSSLSNWVDEYKEAAHQRRAANLLK